MKYLIYDKVTKVVQAIRGKVDDENCKVARSDEFEIGDEFEYHIIINSIDENGVVGSYSAVKQSSKVADLMKRINEKDLEIKELQELVADLIELQLMG